MQAHCHTAHTSSFTLLPSATAGLSLRSQYTRRSHAVAVAVLLALAPAAVAVVTSIFPALSVAGVAAAAAAAGAAVVVLLPAAAVVALTGAFRASANDFLRPHTLPPAAAASLFSSTTAAAAAAIPATAAPCALSADCGEPLLAAPALKVAELDLGDVAAVVDSPDSVTAAFLGLLLLLLCLVGERGEAVVTALAAEARSEERSAGAGLFLPDKRTGDLPRAAGDVCCAAGASAACSNSY
jgi:hypothetical protein